MFETYERGDIVWMNFNPSLGHEQRGKRPALVWTNKESQMVSGFATVIPITSHDKNYPLHVKLTGLVPEVHWVIMTEQFISVDLQERKMKKITNCGPKILSKVDEIIADMIV